MIFSELFWTINRCLFGILQQLLLGWTDRVQNIAWPVCKYLHNSSRAVLPFKCSHDSRIGWPSSPFYTPQMSNNKHNEPNLETHLWGPGSSWRQCSNTGMLIIRQSWKKQGYNSQINWVDLAIGTPSCDDRLGLICHLWQKRGKREWVSYDG